MAHKKRYPRKLADDGFPQEMFQDVLRASHRWLMSHDPEYRSERLSIERWMQIHNIPSKLQQGQQDEQQ